MATKRLKTKGKGVCGASLEERVKLLELGQHNIVSCLGSDSELLCSHSDHIEKWANLMFEINLKVEALERPWYSRLWAWMGGR